MVGDGSGGQVARVGQACGVHGEVPGAAVCGGHPAPADEAQTVAHEAALGVLVAEVRQALARPWEAILAPGRGSPAQAGPTGPRARRLARPAGTQGAGGASAVSGSAWLHASVRAIRPPGRRNESRRNASPSDTVSVGRVARALRLLGALAPSNARANSPVAGSWENIPRPRLRHAPRVLPATLPGHARSSLAAPTPFPAGLTTVARSLPPAKL